MDKYIKTEIEDKKSLLNECHILMGAITQVMSMATN